MKKQGIGKNLLIQGLYQFIILGVPLIVSPYLTRTLGSEQLGIYTYTHSIAYYFVIFAMLGINRHGQRSVAAAVDDPIKLRKTFWSLYCVHAVLSAAAIVGFVLFVTFADIDNKLIFAIQTFYVISALFDITWLFYGLENFVSVVVRNTLVKTVELILIFTLVKSQADTAVYTLIMAASVLAGQACMLLPAIRLVKPIKFSWSDAKGHIKPLCMLSISVIAVSLYTVLNKTLLGVMLDMSSVSYYEYSDRLVAVPKTILGVVSTVLFPKVCRLVENKESKQLQEVFDFSFMITAVLGIGAAAVLAGVARTFAPLYYGSDFSMCGSIMVCLCPVIVIISLGDIVRTQLMISRKKDGQFIVCVLMNAMVNLILSFSLIKVIGVYGAVVGTLGAELCGLVLECWFCRTDISFRQMLRNTVPFVLIGGISIVPMILWFNAYGISWGSLLVQAGLGGGAYVLLTALYVMLFRKDVLQSVKRILTKS